jgi:hypothetical protein
MWFKARVLGRGVLILAAIAVFGLVVMLLWNAVVPGVFSGTRTLDYRQALCLLVLSRILFGGFRGRGGRPGRRWQRLENLTPEERRRFRRGECRPNEETESGS